VDDDDVPLFKLLLEYMYTGNDDFVDDTNVIALISMTNYYGIQALKEVCGKLLGTQISQGNLFYLLDLVDKYDCKQLAAQCGAFLACNFAPILAENKKRVLSLPVETWLRC